MECLVIRIHEKIFVVMYMCMHYYFLGPINALNRLFCYNISYSLNINMITSSANNNFIYAGIKVTLSQKCCRETV